MEADSKKLEQRKLYTAKIDLMYQNIEEFVKLKDENKWKLHTQKPNKLVHTKEDVSGPHIVRVESTLTASPKTIFMTLFDNEEFFRECDFMIDKYQMLDKIDQNHAIIYYQSKQYYTVSPRYMIQFMSRRPLTENRFALCGMTFDDYVNDPTIAMKSKPVRAESFYYYLVEPDKANPEHSRIIFVLKMDLKGMFPNFIQNMFTGEMAK